MTKQAHEATYEAAQKWLTNILAPCANGDKATVTPKQYAVMVELLNKHGESLNTIDTALANGGIAPPIVKTVYREIESAEMVAKVKALEAQLRERKEARTVSQTVALNNTRAVMVNGSTAQVNDFTLLFNAALQFARTSDQIAQVRSMIQLHKQNPRLSWDEIYEHGRNTIATTDSAAR